MTSGDCSAADGTFGRARFHRLAQRFAASLPLRQSPQIECRVGRFFRRQRLRRADDALGGGVVAGAVDRFDHCKFAVAEAEG